MFIKVRNLGYLCLLIFSAVIVSFDLYYRVFLGQNLTPSAGAAMIPQEATVVAYIASDPYQWTQLKSFLPLTVQEALVETYRSWLKKIVIVSRTNYRKSVQPWLGNLVFAFIPAQSSQNTDGNHFLIVAGIKNKIQAYTFGKTIENDSKLQKNFETYKKFPVVEVSDLQSTIFLALVNNKLLVSDSHRVVERAIETSQSNQSFLNREDAKAFFSQQETKNLMARVYVPVYAQLHQSLLDLVSESGSKSEIQMAEVESVFVGVTVHHVEVQLDVLANLNTEVTKQKCQAIARRVSRLLEAELLLDFASQGGSLVGSEAVIEASDRCSLHKSLKNDRHSLSPFS
ncbi:MAG: DUF3352 domain-containing protein [Cyanophyceae cyanobacterium]